MTERENVTVDTVGEFVRVTYERVMPDGIDMGGKLVVERSSVRPLASALSECAADDMFEPRDLALGLDRLRIYRSGSDYSPFVNVLNRRDESSPNGGLSGVVMSVGAAKDLERQLERFLDGAPRAQHHLVPVTTSHQASSRLLGRFERAGGETWPVVFVYSDSIEIQWKRSEALGYDFVRDDGPPETFHRGSAGWPDEALHRIERVAGADVASEVTKLLSR